MLNCRAAVQFLAIYIYACASLLCASVIHKASDVEELVVRASFKNKCHMFENH